MSIIVVLYAYRELKQRSPEEMQAVLKKIDVLVK